MKILDQYVMSAPSQQNAIDLFAGEWASKIPGNYNSGNTPLFQDGRIDLIAKEVGGFQRMNILELGPLEAAHTTMLIERGAKSVTAIEANSRAFAKCLIVKEILDLSSAKFMLGNFDEYIKKDQKFDFVLACGVIYHCVNPIETVVNLTRTTDKIGIWSHYFIEDQVRPKYGEKFSYTPETLTYQGYKGNCYKHNYSDALDIEGFCGGGNAFTRWMDRKSWFDLFDALGFELKVCSENEHHINGPEFTAVALKKAPPSAKNEQ